MLERSYGSLLFLRIGIWFLLHVQDKKKKKKNDKSLQI